MTAQQSEIRSDVHLGCAVIYFLAKTSGLVGVVQKVATEATLCAAHGLTVPAELLELMRCSSKFLALCLCQNGERQNPAVMINANSAQPQRAVKSLSQPLAVPTK